MRKKPDVSWKDHIHHQLDKSSEAGCWEWMNARDQHGYGVVRKDGRNQRVHRVLWELECGPIPPGIHLCHQCDNPACANPEHLFMGGQQENLRDASAKGRTARGDGHGSAKLYSRDIPLIRAMADGGWSYAEIARHYRVSGNAIKDIVTGVTWAHI